MKIDEKDQISFLRDEYLFVQAQYEDFDRRSITMKGWVASGSIVALSLSYKDSISFSVFMALSVVIVSLMVWYLEATWKLFQYSLADRIRVLEANFRGDEDVLIKNPDPFQVYNSWFRSYAYDEPVYEYEKTSRPGQPARPRSSSMRLYQSARQRFVHLPYSIIILLSLASIVMRLLT